MTEELPECVPGLVDEDDTKTDAGLSKPTAPSMRVFWKTLLSKRIRHTKCCNETRCPLHDNGPVWELRLKNTLAELRGLGDGPDHVLRRKELVAVQRRLASNVKRYELHLKQYAAQRARTKEIERRLQPGQAIVYRDFVNMYIEAGGTTKNSNQLKNLQLVVLWRDQAGEPLRCLKLAHLCTDKETQSCDAYYVADVFDFQLSKPDGHHYGFLSKFKKVFICGDHGPHFAAKATMFNESTFKVLPPSHTTPLHRNPITLVRSHLLQIPLPRPPLPHPTPPGEVWRGGSSRVSVLVSCF
jgi:hypothetical protein